MIRIEGIEELQRKFDKLTDSRQAGLIRQAIGRAAKPVRDQARQEAPKADKDIKRRTKDKKNRSGVVIASGTETIYKPGNLKKSIAIVKTKSKTWPGVWVGARAGGKYKYDGYYAHFVHEGHKDRGGGMTKKDEFMKRAKDKKYNQVVSSISDEVVFLMKKRFNA